MGKIKQALEDDRLRQRVAYVLMHNLVPVSVYLDEQVAQHDAWMCNMDNNEHCVVRMPLHTDTIEDIL